MARVAAPSARARAQSAVNRSKTRKIDVTALRRSKPRKIDGSGTVARAARRRRERASTPELDAEEIIHFTDAQNARLEKLFLKNNNPSWCTLNGICIQLGLDMNDLEIWFYNRRIIKHWEMVKDNNSSSGIYSLRSSGPSSSGPLESTKKEDNPPENRAYCGACQTIYVASWYRGRNPNIHQRPKLFEYWTVSSSKGKESASLENYSSSKQSQIEESKPETEISESESFVDKPLGKKATFSDSSRSDSDNDYSPNSKPELPVAYGPTIFKSKSKRNTKEESVPLNQDIKGPKSKGKQFKKNQLKRKQIKRKQSRFRRKKSQSQRSSVVSITEQSREETKSNEPSVSSPSSSDPSGSDSGSEYSPDSKPELSVAYGPTIFKSKSKRKVKEESVSLNQDIMGSKPNGKQLKKKQFKRKQSRFRRKQSQSQRSSVVSITEQSPEETKSNEPSASSPSSSDPSGSDSGSEYSPDSKPELSVAYGPTIFKSKSKKKYFKEESFRDQTLISGSLATSSQMQLSMLPSSHKQSSKLACQSKVIRSQSSQENSSRAQSTSKELSKSNYSQNNPNKSQPTQKKPFGSQSSQTKLPRSTSVQRKKSISQSSESRPIQKKSLKSQPNKKNPLRSQPSQGKSSRSQYPLKKSVNSGSSQKKSFRSQSSQTKPSRSPSRQRKTSRSPYLERKSSRSGSLRRRKRSKTKSLCHQRISSEEATHSLSPSNRFHQNEFARKSLKKQFSRSLSPQRGLHRPSSSKNIIQRPSISNKQSQESRSPRHSKQKSPKPSTSYQHFTQLRGSSPQSTHLPQIGRSRSPSSSPCEVSRPYIPSTYKTPKQRHVGPLFANRLNPRKFGKSPLTSSSDNSSSDNSSSDNSSSDNSSSAKSSSAKSSSAKSSSDNSFSDNSSSDDSSTLKQSSDPQLLETPAQESIQIESSVREQPLSSLKSLPTNLEQRNSPALIDMTQKNFPILSNHEHNNSPVPSNHEHNNVPVHNNHEDNNSPEPSNHEGNNSPEPSNHEGNNSPKPSNHEGNNSPRPSNHEDKNSSVPSNYEDNISPMPSNLEHNNSLVSSNLEHNNSPVSSDIEHNKPSDLDSVTGFKSNTVSDLDPVTLPENDPVSDHEHNNSLVPTGLENNNSSVPIYLEHINSTEPSDLDLSNANTMEHESINPEAIDPLAIDKSMPNALEPKSLTSSGFDLLLNNSTVLTSPGENNSTVPSDLNYNDSTVPSDDDYKNSTVPSDADNKNSTVPSDADNKNSTVPSDVDYKNSTVPSDIDNKNSTVPTDVEYKNSTVPSDIDNKNSIVSSDVDYKNSTVPSNVDYKNSTVPSDLDYKNSTVASDLDPKNVFSNVLEPKSLKPNDSDPMRPLPNDTDPKSHVLNDTDDTYPVLKDTNPMSSVPDETDPKSTVPNDFDSNSPVPRNLVLKNKAPREFLLNNIISSDVLPNDPLHSDMVKSLTEPASHSLSLSLKQSSPKTLSQDSASNLIAYEAEHSSSVASQTSGDIAYVSSETLSPSVTTSSVTLDATEPSVTKSLMMTLEPSSSDLGTSETEANIKLPGVLEELESSESVRVDHTLDLSKPNTAELPAASSSPVQRSKPLNLSNSPKLGVSTVDVEEPLNLSISSEPIEPVRMQQPCDSIFSDTDSIGTGSFTRPESLGSNSLLPATSALENTQIQALKFDYASTFTTTISKASRSGTPETFLSDYSANQKVSTLFEQRDDINPKFGNAYLQQLTVYGAASLRKEMQYEETAFQVLPPEDSMERDKFDNTIELDAEGKLDMNRQTEGDNLDDTLELDVEGELDMNDGTVGDNFDNTLELNAEGQLDVNNGTEGDNLDDTLELDVEEVSSPEPDKLEMKKVDIKKSKSLEEAFSLEPSNLPPPALEPSIPPPPALEPSIPPPPALEPSIPPPPALEPSIPPPPAPKIYHPDLSQELIEAVKRHNQNLVRIQLSNFTGNSARTRSSEPNAHLLSQGNNASATDVGQSHAHRGHGLGGHFLRTNAKIIDTEYRSSPCHNKTKKVQGNGFGNDAYYVDNKSEYSFPLNVDQPINTRTSLLEVSRTIGPDNIDRNKITYLACTRAFNNQTIEGHGQGQRLEDPSSISGNQVGGHNVTENRVRGRGQRTEPPLSPRACTNHTIEGQAQGGGQGVEGPSSIARDQVGGQIDARSILLALAALQSSLGGSDIQKMIEGQGGGGDRGQGFEDSPNVSENRDRGQRIEPLVSYNHTIMLEDPSSVAGNQVRGQAYSFNTLEPPSSPRASYNQNIEGQDQSQRDEPPLSSKAYLNQIIEGQGQSRGQGQGFEYPSNLTEYRVRGQGQRLEDPSNVTEYKVQDRGQRIESHVSSRASYKHTIEGQGQGLEDLSSLAGNQVRGQAHGFNTIEPLSSPKASYSQTNEGQSRGRDHWLENPSGVTGSSVQGRGQGQRNEPLSSSRAYLNQTIEGQSQGLENPSTLNGNTVRSRIQGQSNGPPELSRAYLNQTIEGHCHWLENPSSLNGNIVQSQSQGQRNEPIASSRAYLNQTIEGQNQVLENPSILTGNIVRGQGQRNEPPASSRPYLNQAMEGHGEGLEDPSSVAGNQVYGPAHGLNTFALHSSPRASYNQKMEGQGQGRGQWFENPSNLTGNTVQGRDQGQRNEPLVSSGAYPNQIIEGQGQGLKNPSSLTGNTVRGRGQGQKNEPPASSRVYLNETIEGQGQGLENPSSLNGNTVRGRGQRNEPPASSRAYPNQIIEGQGLGLENPSSITGNQVEGRERDRSHGKVIEQRYPGQMEPLSHNDLLYWAFLKHYYNNSGLGQIHEAYSRAALYGQLSRVPSPYAISPSSHLNPNNQLPGSVVGPYNPDQNQLISNRLALERQGFINPQLSQSLANLNQPAVADIRSQSNAESSAENRHVAEGNVQYYRNRDYTGQDVRGATSREPKAGSMGRDANLALSRDQAVRSMEKTVTQSEKTKKDASKKVQRNDNGNTASKPLSALRLVRKKSYQNISVPFKKRPLDSDPEDQPKDPRDSGK